MVYKPDIKKSYHNKNIITALIQTCAYYYSIYTAKVKGKKYEDDKEKSKMLSICWRHYSLHGKSEGIYKLLKVTTSKTNAWTEQGHGVQADRQKSTSILYSGNRYLQTKFLKLDYKRASKKLRIL